MSIVERIKESIAKKNLTMTQLEENLGFGRRTIYKWDKNFPSIDKVVSVANFLDISLSWLATGKTETISLSQNEFLHKYESLSDIDKKKVDIFMELASIDPFKDNHSYHNENEPLTNYVRESTPSYYADIEDNIAILGYVAAGKPIEGISIPLGYTTPPVQSDYALIAKGHSMEPVIHNGEYVYVKNCDTLSPGEIGIFYLDGEVTCKVYFPTEKALILKSLNPNFAPFKYSLNEEHDFKIQGKVVLTETQKERFCK